MNRTDLAEEIVTAVEAELNAQGTERMMHWFAFEHLPLRLQKVSRAFFNMAEQMMYTLEPGPERTVAFRKLLEAKDAAVRAMLIPSG